MKTGIDQEKLVEMFSQATAKQGEALRKAVADATLKALQGRELSLQNIRKVVKSVTEATSAGVAQNPAPAVDVEALLSKAFAGMDSALLQAVEANRKALQQFVGQGVGLQEKQMKTAMAELEKMEDTFFAAVGKAAQAASEPMKGPWEQVLTSMKLKGTQTGAQATLTVEQLLEQTQTALRDSRNVSARAMQAMLDSYSSLVSGVLIGMSEGLQQGGVAAPAGAAKPAAARKK
jgi:hypothetical protein